MFRKHRASPGNGGFAAIQAERRVIRCMRMFTGRPPFWTEVLRINGLRAV
ncbi:hypothetical protein [Azospirillum palustre]